MKEPWRGRLITVQMDLLFPEEFYEDLAADIVEQLETRLAFEAWADQKENT